MTAPARARRIHARRRRDAVLDAARKVSAQEVNAPLRTLAQAATVDHAEPSRHFGTREKLVEQADPAGVRAHRAAQRPSTARSRHTRPKVRTTSSKHAATADLSRSRCDAAREQRRASE